MMESEKLERLKSGISERGFAIIDNVYDETEVHQMLGIINQADSSNDRFRKSSDIFAIRQFLKELPDAGKLILKEHLRELINSVFGEGYFVVKSIYFDKPETSNWFVAYHQDLTISVDRKIAMNGFGPWSKKQEQYAVQPPLSILERNFTIRIHLDDTDEHNGALKVIDGSHLKGIYKSEDIDKTKENESICNVPSGGIMIMKPLLLHSSGRTTNSKKRRVIHIEFSNATLPDGLSWSEKLA